MKGGDGGDGGKGQRNLGRGGARGLGGSLDRRGKESLAAEGGVIPGIRKKPGGRKKERRLETFA